MKRKVIYIKIAIDLIMLILMMLVMAYHILPPFAHEVIGITLFILYLIHIGLNYKWFIRIFKGKYTLSRSYRTILNLGLLVIMILIILSSFMISLEIFKFSEFGSAAVGRPLHLVCTIWCFIIVSMHFGFHLDMIKNLVIKHMKSWVNWIFRGIWIILFGYMIYVLINRQLFDMLFNQTMFAYFPYGESYFQFFIDYFAILIGFAGISYYINKGLVFCTRRKYKRKEK